MVPDRRRPVSAWSISASRATACGRWPTPTWSRWARRSWKRSAWPTRAGRSTAPWSGCRRPTRLRRRLPRGARGAARLPGHLHQPAARGPQRPAQLQQPGPRDGHRHARGAKALLGAKARPVARQRRGRLPRGRAATRSIPRATSPHSWAHSRRCQTDEAEPEPDLTDPLFALLEVAGEGGWLQEVRVRRAVLSSCVLLAPPGLNPDGFLALNRLNASPIATCAPSRSLMSEALRHAEVHLRAPAPRLQFHVLHSPMSFGALADARERVGAWPGCRCSRRSGCCRTRRMVATGSGERKR